MFINQNMEVKFSVCHAYQISGVSGKRRVFHRSFTKVKDLCSSSGIYLVHYGYAINNIVESITV